MVISNKEFLIGNADLVEKLNKDNAIHIGFNKEVGVMNMTGIIGSGMIVTINVLISLVIGGCLAIKLIEK